MSSDGMVLVNESFLNKLLLKVLPPPEIKKSQLQDDELNYFNELNSLITDSINIAITKLESDEFTEFFNESTKSFMKKSFNIKDFFDVIESAINEIVNSKASTVDDMIANFYEVGSRFGFKQIKREFIFSPADANSLFTIKNYNFNLIKNLTNDLKLGIRETIWRGVAQGESPVNIAKRLRELPLEPLKKGQSIRSRSIAIARTETMRAKNTGTLMAYKNYGVNQVYVPSIGDGNECSDCLEVVSGGPYSIEEAAKILPVHTNCRHHFSPFMEALLEPTDLKASDFVDMTVN